MKGLKPHKFAELLPMMSEAEYQALKADVLANKKFNEPAMIYQGELLDGRNRQRVSQESGVPLPVIKFKGTDAQALSYVYSKAVHRNMTDSQKAAAAVKMLPHFEKLAISRMISGGCGTSSTGSTTGKSRDQAGALFGVSGRYVAQARQIFDADSKLFKEVFDGRLPVTRARRLVLRKQRTITVKRLGGGMIATPDDFQIITGEAVAEMNKLPRKKFRLAFYDPPYNLGFDYDGDPTGDKLPDSKYLHMIRRSIEQTAELLTPDGALCLMICEEWVHHFGLIIEEAGLHIRRLIVWHESFGQAGNKNFGRTCRFIWYAVKNPNNFVFDESAALTESKRKLLYNDKRAMPGGKVLDAMWDINRVCGTYAERIPDEGIPTQLPIELVKRAICIFTDPGDWVIDPYAGTGTTARAALVTGRKCVSIDRSKKYTAIIARELALAGKGK